MSRPPRVLVVEEAVQSFAPLVRTATAAGARLGWLDLAERPATTLDSAAELGFLRAVAVDERGSVAVKTRHGAPVLRDLLREHFVGCVAVLVRVGPSPPPGLRQALESSARLGPGQRGWRVSFAGREQELDGAELLLALGRPSFWRSDDTGASP
jgi:hypothetical protein